MPASPASMATVTLDRKLGFDLIVAVEASDEDVVMVPPTVTVPAGQTSAMFPVNVLDDGLVDGDQTIEITASPTDSVFNLPIDQGVATADLDVTDADGPSLVVKLATDSIAEGTSTTATVTRNTPPTEDLIVSLSNTAFANKTTVPATVIIPAGKTTSAPFPITSADDGTNDGVQPSLIVASVPGFGSGSATLQVTDVDLPDLKVTSITAPASGLTEGTAQISWTVTNTGLSSARRDRGSIACSSRPTPRSVTTTSKSTWPTPVRWPSASRTRSRHRSRSRRARAVLRHRPDRRQQ